jgi:glycosyltransferase involved in cell wall biosynthesis
MKICVISEGGYPVARGGLGEWAHSLISNLRQVEYAVFALVTGSDKPVWERLPNISSMTVVSLTGDGYAGGVIPKGERSASLAVFLREILRSQPMDFASIIDPESPAPISKKWLLSRDHWRSVVHSYEESDQGVPFTEYYWTVMGLHAIIIDCLNAFISLPRADVYHALSAGFAGLLGSMGKAVYGTPYVLTEQGLFLRERENELQRLDVSDLYRRQVLGFSESLVKTSYRYADAVVPPCHSHKFVGQQYGLDLNKVRVITNGINCQHFIPGPRRNGGEPVVGCFARVVPVKDLEVLIRAAGVVCQDHKASFIVAGEAQDQQYFNDCQRLVEGLGLNDRFKFLGHVDSLAGLHQVDIFTLSSYSEGVPYALLEAMGCGLPAVCTAVGGVPEIIREDTGFVVPPKQPEALAGRICTLLDDRKLRLKMGRRARQVALEDYTLDVMAEKFLNLYRELAHEC